MDRLIPKIKMSSIVEGSDKKEPVQKHLKINDTFDRKSIIYFHCNWAGHSKLDCLNLKKRSSSNVLSHFYVEVNLEDCFVLHLKTVKIIRV